MTTTKHKPGHLNDGSRLDPGTLVFCDPEYTWDAVDAGKAPTLKIPANVLRVYSDIVQVEIIDELDKTGKRKFTNTDIYGSTCHVLLSTITRQPV